MTQKRSLDAIERVQRATAEFIESKGYPPSLREIAQATELNHVTVLSHLWKLRRAGILTWDEGRPRTLRFIISTSAQMPTESDYR